MGQEEGPWTQGHPHPHPRWPQPLPQDLGSTSPVLRCSQDVVLASKWEPLVPATLNNLTFKSTFLFPSPRVPGHIQLQCLAPGALKEAGHQGFSQPLEEMSQLPSPSLLRLLNAGIRRCPISSSHLPSSSAFLLNPLARQERKFSFLSPNHPTCL